MTAQFKINLTPEAEALVANLQAMPANALMAIARAMDQENLITESHIRETRLTGQGPFPVEQHRLGRRTGRLRESLASSPAVISGNQVVSGIGSNVVYAAVHEFGTTIHRKEREQKIRLRTDARGNLMRQLGHSNLAVFARSSSGYAHNRFKESTVKVGAHDVVMPERAPVRTGIQECLPNYNRSLSAALIAALTPK